MKAIIILHTCCICLVNFSGAQITTFNQAFGYTNGQGLWQDGALGIAELEDSTILTLCLSNWLQAPRGNIVITKFSALGDQLEELPYGRDSTYFLAGQQGTMIKTIEG